MPQLVRGNAGFTLVELVMAMAVFSFMLLIIVVGMLNIMRMHNAALASNLSQDSARAAMDDLVTSVRNSSGVDWANTNTLSAADTNSPKDSVLCIFDASSHEKTFLVRTKILYRNDSGCTTAVAGRVPVTDSAVAVNDFQVKQTTSDGFNKQEVDFNLTLSSNNGSTTGSGATTKCANTTYDREFCSVVQLSSGAVPR